MDANVLNDLGTVALVTAAPAAPLFVLTYMRSPWKTTAPGRALMLEAVSVTVLVILFTLSVVLGHDFPGRGWLRLFGFGFVSFSLWWMLWTLHDVRRKADLYGLEDDDQGKVTNRADTTL